MFRGKLASVILDLAGYPVLYSLVLAIAIISILRINKLDHIPKLRH